MSDLPDPVDAYRRAQHTVRLHSGATFWLRLYHGGCPTGGVHVDTRRDEDGRPRAIWARWERAE